MTSNVTYAATKCAVENIDIVDEIKRSLGKALDLEINEKLV